MREVPSVFIGVLMCGWACAANATPVVPVDPPFSTDRIERLPPEIRRVVFSRCATRPEAGHYFATFENDSNVIHLDYSRFQCGGPQRFCTTSGCLHQAFVMTHGRYVLMRSNTSDYSRP